MKSKSLVDFPYNYQFGIGERVKFYGEKYTITNVVNYSESGDQKLYLENEESTVIIHKNGEWNTQRRSLLKLIVRGV